MLRCSDIYASASAAQQSCATFSRILRTNRNFLALRRQRRYAIANRGDSRAVAEKGGQQRSGRARRRRVVPVSVGGEAAGDEAARRGPRPSRPAMSVAMPSPMQRISSAGGLEAGRAASRAPRQRVDRRMRLAEIVAPAAGLGIGRGDRAGAVDAPVADVDDDVGVGAEQLQPLGLAVEDRSPGSRPASRSGRRRARCRRCPRPPRAAPARCRAAARRRPGRTPGPAPARCGRPGGRTARPPSPPAPRRPRRRPGPSTSAAPRAASSCARDVAGRAAASWSAAPPLPPRARNRSSAATAAGKARTPSCRQPQRSQKSTRVAGVDVVQRCDDLGHPAPSASRPDVSPTAGRASAACGRRTRGMPAAISRAPSP